MINYRFNRHTHRLFCEIKNPAARAATFINYEYAAGGEPVYLGTEVAVRKTGGKFIQRRRQAQTRALMYNKARRAMMRKTFKSVMIRHEHSQKVGRLIAGMRIKPNGTRNTYKPVFG